MILTFFAFVWGIFTLENKVILPTPEEKTLYYTVIQPFPMELAPLIDPEEELYIEPEMKVEDVIPTPAVVPMEVPQTPKPVPVFVVQVAPTTVETPKAPVCEERPFVSLSYKHTGAGVDGKHLITFEGRYTTGCKIDRESKWEFKSDLYPAVNDADTYNFGTIGGKDHSMYSRFTFVDEYAERFTGSSRISKTTTFTLTVDGVSERVTVEI